AGAGGGAPGRRRRSLGGVGMRGYLGSTVHALATSLANLFRRPVTVEFPKVIRPRAERYRSSFALLHDEDGDEACIGCLQCERICPSEVISIKVGGKRESPVTGKKRGYADDFVLDLNACIYCELCVQVCPTDAIVMTREPELPAYGREDLVLTMAKLYANEKSKPRAWGDATRLNAMQTPPKPPRTEAVASSGRPAAATTAPPKAAAPPAPAKGAPRPAPGGARSPPPSRPRPCAGNSFRCAERRDGAVHCRSRADSFARSGTTGQRSCGRSERAACSGRAVRRCLR